jgi:hypothetical protein
MRFIWDDEQPAVRPIASKASTAAGEAAGELRLMRRTYTEFAARKDEPFLSGWTGVFRVQVSGPDDADHLCRAVIVALALPPLCADS